MCSERYSKTKRFLGIVAISQRGLKMKPFIEGTVFDNQKEIKRKGDEMLELIAKDICKEYRIMILLQVLEMD